MFLKYNEDLIVCAAAAGRGAAQIQQGREPLCEILRVSAEECLVFEDSLIGIEAAKNAGMQAAAVYDRHSDGEREQINALADYQVQNYTVLLELLSNR